MALSGSFSSYPVSKFGLYCEWSGSQSVAGNYTDVTLNVYLQFYTLSVGARSDSTISINGTSETYTVPAINDMSSKSWHLVHLKTKTVRVYHNANGTKTGVVLCEGSGTDRDNLFLYVYIRPPQRTQLTDAKPRKQH